MKSEKKQRILAIAGVIVLVGLFILTIVFLLSGNVPMAITMVAINGLVLFIVYFTVRFNRTIEEMNPELFPEDEDEDE